MTTCPCMEPFLFYLIHFCRQSDNMIGKSHLSNLSDASRSDPEACVMSLCGLETNCCYFLPPFVCHCSSRLEPVSTQSTPQGSGAATPDNHSAIDTLSEQDEGTLTPSSKQTTPTTSPRSVVRCEIVFNIQAPSLLLVIA